jgi:hypothetical protein
MGRIASWWWLRNGFDVGWFNVRSTKLNGKRRELVGMFGVVNLSTYDRHFLKEFGEPLNQL